MDLRNLPTVNALSDAVTVCEYNGISIVRIIHEKVEAGISLHGGHLIWFKPAQQDDVIWLSKEAIIDPAKAIRGGIPVCWPWFGKAGNPSHGFARNSQWQLKEHRENENGVIVALGLQDTAQTREIWPYRFDLTITFELGDELKVSLTSTNTDDKAWSYGGALHTYFDIASIRETHLTGMGASYLDGVQGGIACEGGDSLTIDQEVDRVYNAPEAVVTIHDAPRQRQIRVENHGHNAAVIWNPWQALCEGMADMANDSFETMVCVESTIHGEGVTLEPGQSHTLATIISLAAV
ncbi:D-hexose-6-phosphate mutarotase [Photobacterium jeanii]|uniref:Putative glucose-6-phosphate 1-epimerase n=1 Tax=Photobacterium jeanii TaxID=858640 RepID=A0A178KA64_9GAMM|nr:D-hexose-6-phosphate mutarotase [Photobacterium jeanii]OAN13604.1 D-hexose-6-phosphate mutarotase [Photobacterium jeanii]PST88722.1 D-hexose-6-phosphate mutarotase [Photobacterium jeanii]